MQDGIARMGEVVFSGPGLPELRALGLGSCIGLCAFDPGIKLACMAHIVLPQAKIPGTSEAGKYADTAVQYVINEMKMRGANPTRMKFAIAGGAQLFSFENSDNRMDIGKRNTVAVKQHLSTLKMKLVAEDTGGKTGRTVLMDAATGTVSVKQAGGTPKVLAVLS